jgi:hypothetical protein
VHTEAQNSQNIPKTGSGSSKLARVMGWSKLDGGEIEGIGLEMSAGTGKSSFSTNCTYARTNGYVAGARVRTKAKNSQNIPKTGSGSSKLARVMG